MKKLTVGLVIVWLIVVAFTFTVVYGLTHSSPAPWEPCDAPLNYKGCGR